MAYRVEIARRAEADLEELYLRVVERRRCRAPDGSMVSNAQSSVWTSIRSGFPSRPRASTPITLRVLTYGRKPHTYRIFFTVDDDYSLVRVLHVRRGARPISEELRGD